MTLKECPFCGKEATIGTVHLRNRTAVRYTAKCPSCAASAKLCVTPELAAQAWNRRTNA